MKIGILADIHEHVDHLRSAIKTFRHKHVDQVVLLGDVFETGERIQDTIALLRDVNSLGVWGNHDLGLCHDPDPGLTARFDTTIVEFLGSLTPRFELEGILFSHGLPTWDATDPAIYYLGDSPWGPGSLSSVFAGFPHRLFCIGHYHRWHLATRDRSTAWDGMRPIILQAGERYFLIVHAVFCGWCAILDTETSEFTPCFVG